MSESKFTPERQASLVTRIGAGVSHRDASLAEGISRQTLATWLAKGRAGDPVYADFAQAVDDAVAPATSCRRAVPMSADDLFRAVSEAARKGSVAAMRLAWGMLAERDGRPI